MIKLDLGFAQPELRDEEWQQFQPFIDTAHKQLHSGKTPGSDYLGWLHLPSLTLEAGVKDLLETAAEIRNQAEALVVIGIGGSYLGAHAAFEWTQSAYYNQMSHEQRGGPEIYFAGNHLSGRSMQELLAVLQGKKVFLNVISKSGTTTEPAVAFRILRQWLIQQEGAEKARRQIVATTDKTKGALHQLAVEEGYRTFVIPDNVGGRYSVLTPVGLLPLAVAGVDIVSMLHGALEAEQAYAVTNLGENPAYRYAATRNALYRKGKTTEILAYYEPGLHMFAEWWKQLYGESEGKDAKGIYPSSVGYTTDLHSLGQYVQEGLRNLFETVLVIEAPDDADGDGAPSGVGAANGEGTVAGGGVADGSGVRAIKVPSDPNMQDGLEYLAQKRMSWVNDKARIATQLAHSDGGVPNLLLTVPDRSAATLGHVFYFFELACAMSGLLLGVNPFNQPGVEAYKVNMFALLGKPGFEEQSAEIRKRLGM